MLFEDMNWMDVERYLERDDVVMDQLFAAAVEAMVAALRDL